MNLAAYKYVVCYAMLFVPSFQKWVAAAAAAAVCVCPTVDIVVSANQHFFNDIHTFLICFLRFRFSPGQYVVIAICMRVCVLSARFFSGEYVSLCVFIVKFFVFISFWTNLIALFVCILVQWIVVSFPLLWFLLLLLFLLLVFFSLWFPFPFPLGCAMPNGVHTTDCCHYLFTSN